MAKLRILAILLVASCDRAPETKDLVETIRSEDIRKYQTFLASDELEGRGPGSEGGRKASAYIADQVKSWGFRPAGVDGTYFQPFDEGRRNVVALWPGRGKDGYVVIGAHYDHLGRMGETVFPGADDNASGSSTILCLAKAVSRSRFARGVVCLWFDGEEQSLSGSRWWVAHPTLPLDGCFAMLNCDMIGRNETTKIFCGLEKDGKGAAKYPKWEAEVREVEGRFGANFDWTEFDRFIKRSDHWPFMEKGVPALFFTGGLHADYHKEGDRIEKINFGKEELIGRIIFSILAKAADQKEPLK